MHAAYFSKLLFSFLSAIICSGSATATLAPGGRGGASVLYTFDNTSDDYYGNFDAAPVHYPQYVFPGYNGRGAAIQLLSNQSQCLTIANHMNFYQRSFSVEAWIYPLTISSGDMIIYSQTQVAALGQYMWFLLRGGSSFGAFFGDDVSGTTLFQPYQWQHIAFTYNYTTTTQVVYINGVAGDQFEEIDSSEEDGK